MDATIPLVEDEPAILELLAINVTQCGYRAIRAHDAAAAMAHISRALPDLILLDWMLPDVSGVELARRLRAEPLAPRQCWPSASSGRTVS